MRTDWDFAGSHSVVEGRLSPASTGSALTLTHTMPDVHDEHWETYGPGAAGVGWEMMLCALQHHLMTGPRLDDEAWTRGPDGRAAIEEWSSAWAGAHRSAGADQRIARAAGQRTAEFYLGTQ